MGLVSDSAVDAVELMMRKQQSKVKFAIELALGKIAEQQAAYDFPLLKQPRCEVAFNELRGCTPAQGINYDHIRQQQVDERQNFTRPPAPHLQIDLQLI